MHLHALRICPDWRFWVQLHPRCHLPSYNMIAARLDAFLFPVRPKLHQPTLRAPDHAPLSRPLSFHRFIPFFARRRVPAADRHDALI
jgi:hypothetical protein